MAFWLSWVLMPGVGVTDARTILELVGAARERVLASVVLQLGSAALYAPALVGIASQGVAPAPRGIRLGCTLLLLGAMGSAADAVFHLLAYAMTAHYAMTAPGVVTEPLVEVMQFMQGPGLGLILPFVAAFFVGSVVLTRALARCGRVSNGSPWLHGLGVVVALVGGALVAVGFVTGRAVGLAVLASVSAAQGWAGVALIVESAPRPAPAPHEDAQHALEIKG